MKRLVDGPGGIKPWPTKRAHAGLPTNKTNTRSKKQLLQEADASTQREGMSDTKCSISPVASALHNKEAACNFNDHTQHGVEGKFYYHILFLLS